MSLINSFSTSTAQTSTVSTTQLSPSVQTVGIAAIRDRVLQTIRNAMPITTLFNLKLKINLDLFVKDQMFIYKIARFIAVFPKVGVIDDKAMEKYFENSEIIAEIKTLSKEPAPYLAFFYEACADVLNQKPESLQMTAALEGRIFTLKNALIAQQEPERIHKSQQEKKIAPQSLAQIKNEGAHFIRHSLSLHLKKLESSSFQDSLFCTAKQLIFFVQNITSLYLKEKGHPCQQDDPLTYRNPSGYNFHGFVAALVMETCLNALGYKTRLMGRVDLEPRVTLATRHSVVEVTGLVTVSPKLIQT
jgi:hypothetical protein